MKKNLLFINHAKNIGGSLQSSKYLINYLSKKYNIYIIQKNKPILKKNVMFILVESFSASFMNEFGNKNNITQNLDSFKMGYKSILLSVFAFFCSLTLLSKPSEFLYFNF